MLPPAERLMTFGCFLSPVNSSVERRYKPRCGHRGQIHGGSNMVPPVLLWLLMTSSRAGVSAGGDEGPPAVCPPPGEAFSGSCYRFVGERRSFWDAQARCEREGGHLAFARTEETRGFLRAHMDRDRDGDWWLGLAPSGPPDPDPGATERPGGGLLWLDGSLFSDSDRVSGLLPGACSALLRGDAAFPWTATGDCERKLNFVCQYELGRVVACRGSRVELRCPPGHVIKIDGGRYGRETPHRCRRPLSLPAPSLASSAPERCASADVSGLLSEECAGLEACWADAAWSSLAERCPLSGSYLSVRFHCEEGLELSVNQHGAVWERVSVRVVWKWRAFPDHLTCRLSTGDGRLTLLQSRPSGSESRAAHCYARPGGYTVGVRCSGAGGEADALSVQAEVVIGGGSAELQLLTCRSGGVLSSEQNCAALLGTELEIRPDRDAGCPGVTYTLLRAGGAVLARSARGPGLAVSPAGLALLGPGCHGLRLQASGGGDGPHLPETRSLRVCVLEAVDGLSASMASDQAGCPRSPDVSVGVRLRRGAPVRLLFTLTGLNGSVSQSWDMRRHAGVFHVRNPFQGPLLVRLRASNRLSSGETLVVCCSCDAIGSRLLMANQKSNLLETSPSNVAERAQAPPRVRVVRASLQISAAPGNTVTSPDQSITLSVTLSVTGGSNSNSNSNSASTLELTHQWKCDQCRCSNVSTELSVTVTSACLPNPFEFYKYVYSQYDVGGIRGSDNTCITVSPAEFTAVSIECYQGCDPVTALVDVKLRLLCGSCPDVVWNIENPANSEDWVVDKECYRSAGKRPLVDPQPGGTEYTVPTTRLAEALQRGRNLTVVAYGTSANGFSTYSIGVAPYLLSTVPTSTNTSPEMTQPQPATAPARPTTSPRPTTPTPPWAGACQYGAFECEISPPEGSVLTGFRIRCSSASPCPHCTYHFKTAAGASLCCADQSEVTSLFLPAGPSESDHMLTINVSMEGSDCVATVSAEVRPILVEEPESGGAPSVEELQAAVEAAVANLTQQGLRGPETLAQLFLSVANVLNGRRDQSQRDAKMKLRAYMVQQMEEGMGTPLCSSTEEIQLAADVLHHLLHNAPTPKMQTVSAAMVLNMSSSLLSGATDRLAAATSILGLLSDLFALATEKPVLDALLQALDEVQSVLLEDLEVDSGPLNIMGGNIGLQLNRVRPGRLLTEPIFSPNTSSPTFSLPPEVAQLLSTSEAIDVRMRFMTTNPFRWNPRGNISGLVSSLSIKGSDGTELGPMAGELEILLPRPGGEQQGGEFLLDLANHSTVLLSVPPSQATLLMKMLPSVDPLPVNVYLGHGAYPTTSNYSLMTKMPFEGTTLEERYSWLVDTAALGGHFGEYFLVLRPIVGPGVKSLNASVRMSIFSASCKFWNTTQLEWSTAGCRLGVGSTYSQTQCFCNHMTDFSSSFFVMPNTIDLSRTAQLFGSFAQNPVVVCFVGALFLAYLLVVIWARRKDLQDVRMLKVTVLEDNDPLEDYRYLLTVSTGHRRGASTSSQVTITLDGSDGVSEPHHLSDPEKRVFERGAVDLFLLTAPFSLGNLQSIRLWHDNSGSDPGWYVSKVLVRDLQTEQKWHFLCNCWLSLEVGDGFLDNVFPVATETDLKGFSNVFYSRTWSGLSDGHLWFSVVSRPPSSSFTCVQRVSCCFSLLLCTMLTSIMFYGVPQDPSEQVMDLGTIEFTWQQFMIGVQSSLLVFPVNVLIVSIFRSARPRRASATLRRPGAKPGAPAPETQAAHRRQDPPPPKPADAGGLGLESVVKDIRRTASSLSKTLKSSAPAPQTDPESGGGGGDIHAALAALAAIVRQHVEQGAHGDSNAVAATAARKSSQHLDMEPPVLEAGPQTSSLQNYRAKTQHLRRQLAYVEGRLGLLDPRLPDRDARGLALQQIHTMKDLLEDPLLRVQDGGPDRLTARPDATQPAGEEGKRRCCGRGGGLPWGCVFLGWLLVGLTSAVAGYFTMLYGLKFGKQLSISWLISMAVSFFESLLVIQPLKVLGLAIFFALVFKKVEEEDDENVQFQKPMDAEAQRGGPVCRDSQLYRPPPPVDLQQMRRNRAKEHKAFALIKEILTYVGFMWMLLLVAYSQRDPNAFHLSQHIRRTFSRGTSSSMSSSQVFSWAGGTLLGNLFGPYSGFITDGNSKLVGSARIRQLRVSRSACEAPRPLDRLVSGCHAPYAWDREDMGSYEPRWRQRAAGDNASDGQTTPWTYQNQDQLRVNSVWGKTAIYRAGGFAADLGPGRPNASGALDHLWSHTWLDTYSRAVFVEFTVYNANVNLFCIVTLILETTATGAFDFRSDLQTIRLYQTGGGAQFFMITIEVFYFLFIFYYMYLQGKKMKEQRWAYFRSKWNLLELSIILLSWASLAMFVVRTLVGNRDMDYYHRHRHHFANFHETATADASLGYLIAFLVLLATVKLWHLMRLNPKLHMIAATLQRAWGDISGFLVVITIMILAYAICGNLLFGWKLASYMTLWDSVSTLISLQLGIFNYKEVLDHSPWLGCMFIGSCTVFMTYMVVNLFITVILMAFSYEREHHTPSEEEEIVDLVLQKLFSLLGVRSPGPRTQTPDASLNRGPPLAADPSPS